MLLFKILCQKIVSNFIWRGRDAQLAAIFGIHVLTMRVVSVRVINPTLEITGTIYLSSTVVGHRANPLREDIAHGHEAVKAFQAKIRLRCIISTRKIDL